MRLRAHTSARNVCCPVSNGTRLLFGSGRGSRCYHNSKKPSRVYAPVAPIYVRLEPLNRAHAYIDGLKFKGAYRACMSVAHAPFWFLYIDIYPRICIYTRTMRGYSEYRTHVAHPTGTCYIPIEYHASMAILYLCMRPAAVSRFATSDASVARVIFHNFFPIFIFSPSPLPLPPTHHAPLRYCVSGLRFAFCNLIHGNVCFTVIMF